MADAGLLTLAATATPTPISTPSTDDPSLAGPTAWVFGTEARGLPDAVLDAVDQHVRIPSYGRAESLNLAASAAVALYASARAQRRRAAPEPSR